MAIFFQLCNFVHMVVLWNYAATSFFLNLERKRTNRLEEYRQKKERERSKTRADKEMMLM